MKSDPIFRARERRREQKYFINGRLTPVWVPLSAPYPTQAIFPAGYGVINYILTASLCSFDFTMIKSAIEVSGPRKCGSQVGVGWRSSGRPWFVKVWWKQGRWFVWQSFRSLHSYFFQGTTDLLLVLICLEQKCLIIGKWRRWSWCSVHSDNVSTSVIVVRPY